MIDFADVIALMQEDEFDGLITLRQIGPQAVPHLVAILNDPSQPTFLRQRAIVALGEIGSADAADDVQTMLNDSNPVIRYMAAIALTKMSGTAATSALIPLLTDADPSVVKVAIQCLTEVGDTQTLAQLETVKAASPHNFLRTEAETAIKQIEERHA